MKRAFVSLVAGTVLAGSADAAVTTKQVRFDSLLSVPVANGTRPNSQLGFGTFRAPAFAASLGTLQSLSVAIDYTQLTTVTTVRPLSALSETYSSVFRTFTSVGIPGGPPPRSDLQAFVMPANATSVTHVYASSYSWSTVLTSLADIASVIQNGLEIRVGNEIQNNFDLTIPRSTFRARGKGVISFSYTYSLPDPLAPGNVPSGIGISAVSVPEPSMWALMIGGMGMVGVALRRRRFAMQTC